MSTISAVQGHLTEFEYNSLATVDPTSSVAHLLNDHEKEIFRKAYYESLSLEQLLGHFDRKTEDYVQSFQAIHSLFAQLSQVVTATAQVSTPEESRNLTAQFSIVNQAHLNTIAATKNHIQGLYGYEKNWFGVLFVLFSNKDLKNTQGLDTQIAALETFSKTAVSLAGQTEIYVRALNDFTTELTKFTKTKQTPYSNSIEQLNNDVQGMHRELSDSSIFNVGLDILESFGKLTFDIMKAPVRLLGSVLDDLNPVKLNTVDSTPYGVHFMRLAEILNFAATDTLIAATWLKWYKQFLEEKPFVDRIDCIGHAAGALQHMSIIQGRFLTAASQSL